MTSLVSYWMEFERGYAKTLRQSLPSACGTRFLHTLFQIPSNTKPRRFGRGWVVLFGLMLTARGEAAGLFEIWRNNSAVSMVEQGKVTEANDEFVGLLADKPFHPIYQFNVASSFITVEEFKKSKKMHEELLKMNPLPDELKFAAHYNLGFLNSLKEDNDVDKALEHYQQALAVRPDSVEVKTNIELLVRQQQGGGKGDKKNKQDQQQGDKGDEQPKEPKDFTNKPQPNQFDSKDMSRQDVKKILEELKKQEQRIRAKHDRKGGKRSDREKNW